jgi:hypothetical protein
MPRPEFTIEEKLKCVERELGMRRRVYSYRVANGKMTRQEADREIDLMASIVEDYKTQGSLSL